MKKTIFILALVLVLGIGSIIAYADSNFIPSFRRNFDRMPMFKSTLTDSEWEEFVNERQEFHEENLQYRKEELKKALDSGEITQEEYDKWLEHFNYMDDFHKENGFGAGCGGRGMGMMRGMGMRRGFGR